MNATRRRIVWRPFAIGRLLLLSALVAVTCPLHGAPPAQQPAAKGFRVEGRILDAEGAPMAGVVVEEKASGKRVLTDKQGNYHIMASGRDAVLTATYMGMAPVETKIDGRSNVDVVLDSGLLLDEMVVIGYGVVRKSDLTGSVASLRSEAIEDRFVLSLEDAIRGQVAGVTVGTNDGQPGEMLQIKIRGIGSINASSSPLYVIDGVPMEETDINPSEIEHIEFLKDASATAIYGSRGANGVVMITTKKGKPGRPNVNVSLKASLQQPVRLIEMADSYDYNLYRDLQRRTVYAPGATIPAKYDLWERYADGEGYVWLFDPLNRYHADHISGKYLQPGATDTDWQRSMLQNTMTYDARLSISGGGQHNTYSIIGSFLSQDGMVLNSGFQKFSLRANFEQSVNNTLKIGFNLSGNTSSQHGAYTNDVDGTMFNMLAQQPIKELNHTDVFEDLEGESALYNNNPWFQATKVRREVNKQNAMVRIYLDQKLGRDFRLNLSGSYDMKNFDNDQYYPTQTRQGLTANGLMRQNDREGYDWLNENLLYYTPKACGKHRWDGLAGVTFQESYMRSLTDEQHNIFYNDFKEFGLNYALTPMLPVLKIDRTRMVSLLARGNYTYDDRFLFTASIRADGSSRFGSDHKWGYFPSGAFSWKISNERFLKDVRAISEIKLRASAGVSGNTAIPPYQTLAMTTRQNYPMDGENPSSGAIVQHVANPSLKWETSTQYDAGVDVALFKNRFTATVDLYLKQTRDLLLLEPVTGTSGYTTRWSNKGEIDNKGLEISLTGRIFQKTAVRWSTSYNMSFNRSKVRYIGESGEMILNASGAAASDFAILRQGMPVGLWYGYKTDGLYRTHEEVNNLPANFMQFGKPKQDMQVGFQRYEDINSDGVIDDGDRTVLGCAEPKFTGGWQNTVSWRQLQLSVNAEFSYGREMFNATALFLERGVQTNNITTRYRKNYWTPTLYDINSGAVVFQGNETASWLPGSPRDAAYGETYAKDLYIEDGSFLRISDITLTYNLPSRFTRKLSMRSLKLIASVRNAWVWTNYTGYDPDVNSATGDYSSLIPGLDNGSYPRARTYTLGLNITF